MMLRKEAARTRWAPSNPTCLCRASNLTGHSQLGNHCCRDALMQDQAPVPPPVAGVAGTLEGIFFNLKICATCVSFGNACVICQLENSAKMSTFSKCANVRMENLTRGAGAQCACLTQKQACCRGHRQVSCVCSRNLMQKPLAATVG